jgi:hypothetical protein
MKKPKVRKAKKIVVKNPKSKHKFIHAPKGTGTIYRGDYELLHQPQIIGRDLTGEEILQHLGGEAFAYMMTDEQVREAREGRKPGLGLPYRYIIKSPETSALAWTAFFTREEMGKWLRAYDLSLTKEPKPGERFGVKLPKSSKKWLPLKRQLGKKKPIVKHNPLIEFYNYKFMTSQSNRDRDRYYKLLNK